MKTHMLVEAKIKKKTKIYKIKMKRIQKSWPGKIMANGVTENTT